MTVPGNRTMLVMIEVWSFQMMGTCVTLPSLIIHISAAATFLKSDIWSYPLSISMVKKQDIINKTETSANITISKTIERIESNIIWGVT